VGYSLCKQREARFQAWNDSIKAWRASISNKDKKCLRKGDGISQYEVSSSHHNDNSLHDVM